MTSAARSIHIHYDEVADYYGRVAPFLFDASWYNDKTIVDFVVRNLPLQASSIVDLCGGTGSIISDILSRRSDVNEYTLIDISSEVCSLARQAYAGDARVQVLRGDWTQPIVDKRRYDVILIKNALHLLDNLQEKLRKLYAISHSTTRVIIIETVSPNLEANDFVKKLFLMAQLNSLKRHYFTEFSLREAFKKGHLPEVRPIEFIDQKISLREWLKGKDVPSLCHKMIWDFVRKSLTSANLKQAMQVVEDRTDGDITMLRRQLCAVLNPRLD